MDELRTNSTVDQTSIENPLKYTSRMIPLDSRYESKRRSEYYKFRRKQKCTVSKLLSIRDTVTVLFEFQLQLLIFHLRSVYLLNKCS